MCCREWARVVTPLSEVLPSGYTTAVHVRASTGFPSVRAVASTRARRIRFTRAMRLSSHPRRPPGRPRHRDRRRDRHPGRTGLIGLVGCAIVLAAALAPAHATDGVPIAAPSSVASPSSAAADNRGSAQGNPRSVWSWPVDGPRSIVRAFVAPAHRFGAGHRGIDVAAPEGAAVLAPAPGVVLFAGPVAGRSVVTVDHGGGVVSSYDPVAPSVTAGDAVTAGARIGDLGPGAAMHCASGCLHVGVRRGGEYVDPVPYFHPPRRSILLPLGP